MSWGGGEPRGSRVARVAALALGVVIVLSLVAQTCAPVTYAPPVQAAAPAGRPGRRRVV